MITCLKNQLEDTFKIPSLARRIAPVISTRRPSESLASNLQNRPVNAGAVLMGHRLCVGAWWSLELRSITSETFPEQIPRIRNPKLPGFHKHLPLAAMPAEGKLCGRISLEIHYLLGALECLGRTEGAGESDV